MLTRTAAAVKFDLPSTPGGRKQERDGNRDAVSFALGKERKLYAVSPHWDGNRADR